MDSCSWLTSFAPLRSPSFANSLSQDTSGCTATEGENFWKYFSATGLTLSGQHLLLVEGLVHSGVTTDFLMSDLRGRGAASVKLATLLDRQSARRVQLQPDYFGFLVDEAFLIGYGLGAADQTSRNLSYLAVAS